MEVNGNQNGLVTNILKKNILCSAEENHTDLNDMSE